MKIAVVQTAFLGDAVLTLPLLQEIKKKYPDARLDVITLPAHEELFRLSPAVDRVIVFDKRKTHKSFSGFLTLAGELRKEQYDLWYSPHRSMRSSLLTIFARPLHSIGFENASLSFVYTEQKLYLAGKHEILRNLNLLEDYSCFNGNLILPEVQPGSEAIEEVEKFLQMNKTDTPIVLIAPGSVWVTKQYPVHYFAAVARSLQKSGYTVLWFGAEKDKPIAEKAGADTGIINCCGRFTLEQSLVLLSRAALLICNDSAPAHLAAAVNTRTLMLYCATLPDFGFTPAAPGSRWLSENVLCKPCNIHGAAHCPQEHFQCGTGLLPETVIRTSLEMLNTTDKNAQNKH